MSDKYLIVNSSADRRFVAALQRQQNISCAVIDDGDLRAGITGAPIIALAVRNVHLTVSTGWTWPKQLRKLAKKAAQHCARATTIVAHP